MKIIFGKKGHFPTFELLKMELDPKGYKRHFDYEYYDLYERNSYEEFRRRGYTTLSYGDFLKNLNNIAKDLPIIIEE